MSEGAVEIGVVVPLFDELGNLDELHRRLVATLEVAAPAFELVYVDDGSRDGTGRRLAELAALDPRVRPVWLSRNFGHQAAVTAGLEHARGRAVAVMDGDLQDPPEVLPDLIAAWRGGHEVVYAVRRDRKEGFLKRWAYAGFYRAWSALSDLEIPLDSGDFGLVDRRALDALNALPERVRFVRGLRAFVGFRQVGVPYARQARGAGKPKYTLGKLVKLAVEGLISFSGRPLRVASYIGASGVAAALALIAWALYDAATGRTAPPGWASTLVVVLFLGSAQLICLGIIGEYLRLIFLEVKRRPTYVARPGPSDAVPVGGES